MSNHFTSVYYFLLFVMNVVNVYLLEIQRSANGAYGFLALIFSFLAVGCLAMSVTFATREPKAVAPPVEESKPEPVGLPEQFGKRVAKVLKDEDHANATEDLSNRIADYAISFGEVEAMKMLSTWMIATCDMLGARITKLDTSLGVVTVEMRPKESEPTKNTTEATE